MKNLLILAAALIIFNSLPAQKNKNKDNNIPAFGNVDKAELEMKECEFDKNAEAEVLFDKGELVYIIGYGIDLERHIRIKILTDKGRDRADIHLRYHSWQNDEDVRDISAQTYNLDASGNMVVTKIDKKQVFEKKLNKRYSEKVFTFPDVKAGSIIEYKYKLTGAGIINWYFQRSIPVKYSEFTFDYPKDVEILISPKCSRPFEKKNENTSSRTVQSYTMKEVPALRNEPYILNDDDYLERIESKTIAYMRDDGRRQSIIVTWPQVIKALMEDEDFGLQIKKEIPRTADLDNELKNIKDPYLRMKTIHNYVKKNMEWNGYEGIWAFDGIKSAWKDKKGTAAEINLILVNLLKDADLVAKPILVSTHNNGLVNTTDAGTNWNPGYNQFNKVLAWVVIDKNIYVLDATDKETPCHLIPPDVIVTEGMVIEKVETFEWGWQTLWKENMQYKNLVLLQASIDADGKMQGEVSLNSYDYARIPRAITARKGKKEFTEKFFSTNNPGINIDSISFENLDSDSLPLGQKVYFNQQLSSSGDYRYFSVNLFTGLEKNPFVADSRVSDVFFGVKQVHSIFGNIDIPEGYVFEELPKNIKMMMPDTSIVITRVAQADESRLSLRISLEFKKPFYTTQEYPEFREFYKKLQDMLNEQFVIRKKAQP